MSQFNAPVRRSGGSLDVYTGLLCAAFMVLVVGVVSMVLVNMDHGGGLLTLVE